jgi:hypothetical protein
MGQQQTPIQPEAVQAFVKSVGCFFIALFIALLFQNLIL